MELTQGEGGATTATLTRKDFADWRPLKVELRKEMIFGGRGRRRVSQGRNCHNTTTGRHATRIPTQSVNRAQSRPPSN